MGWVNDGGWGDEVDCCAEGAEEGGLFDGAVCGHAAF